MAQDNTIRQLLELIRQPAFLAKDGIILFANHEAQQLQIQEGSSITPLLGRQAPVYEQFREGKLCLTLALEHGSCEATVTPTEIGHIFQMDTLPGDLKILALAAQQLRSPLQDVMLAANMTPSDEEAQQKRDAALKHAAHRLQRILGNMSDLSRIRDIGSTQLEATDLVSVFDELMEKLEALCLQAGIRLRYTSLPNSVMGMANRELLSRAVCNLVSNAIKFSAKGSELEAKLTSQKNQLCFTLQDQGSGIAPQVAADMFSRYTRAPGIEDGRYGLGLGLAVVRSIAAAHGGTVLIDHPREHGTRITFTVSLTRPDSSPLRTPVQIPKVDYAGGFDQALLELADVLPPEAYR